MKRGTFSILALLVSVAAQAAPRNKPVLALVRGEGFEKVTSYCSICHSTSYIQMNAPVLDRAGWEKEIHKMVESYGAPVPEGDQKVILEYLVANYSKDAVSEKK